MTEEPWLTQICESTEEDEYRMPERNTVTAFDALNYIAYGRFDGPERTQHYSQHHAGYAGKREHDDALLWYGSRNVACRVLEHALRKGVLSLLQVRPYEDFDDYRLFVVDSTIFSDGAEVFFNGLENGRQTYMVCNVAETMFFEEPIFFAEEVRQLADPPHEVPRLASVERKGKGGRKAGTNGAPIAAFVQRMMALGQQACAKETHDTLGAYLREEYARLNLPEPHPDNAKRDAVGAMRQIWGETSKE